MILWNQKAFALLNGAWLLRCLNPDAKARLQVFDWLEPLRGKDLLCFCPEGEACHGDVLLELIQEHYYEQD